MCVERGCLHNVLSHLAIFCLTPEGVFSFLLSFMEPNAVLMTPQLNRSIFTLFSCLPFHNPKLQIHTHVCRRDCRRCWSARTVMGLTPSVFILWFNCWPRYIGCDGWGEGGYTGDEESKGRGGQMRRVMGERGQRRSLLCWRKTLTLESCYLSRSKHYRPFNPGCRA